MGIKIDGRKDISYVKDSNDKIIVVNKKYKDNYSLSYYQGEHMFDNFKKADVEKYLSDMGARYFSNL